MKHTCITTLTVTLITICIMLAITACMGRI